MRGGIVEPVPVKLDFVTALAAIEDMGVNAQLVFCTRIFSYEACCSILTVRRRLVMPWEAITETAAMLVGHVARRDGTASPNLVR